MNTSPRRTEGATLFVVVLVVLLMLSAIMVITAQITLTGRRSVSDQENTLRTQYAAESSVARAQAQLSVLSKILNPATGSDGSGGTAQFGFNLPSATSSDTVAGYIASLCGLNLATLPLSNPTAPICGSATDINSNVLASATNASSRLGLFTAVSTGSPPSSFISDAALAAAGGPPVGSSIATKQAFWASMFGGNKAINVGTTVNGLTTQGTTGAVISSVWRKTGDEYEIHIRVPDVNVRAAGQTSSRALKVSPQSQEYILYLGRPPFAKYALFTNHHYVDATSESSCATSTACSRITFTSNTIFRGPVHTNGQFNIQDSPQFYGPVSSAGCVAGSLKADGTGCTSQVAGSYFNSTYFQSGSTNPSALLNANGTPKTTPTVTWTNSGGTTLTSTPAFNWTPTQTQPEAPINWSAGYQQLPPNGNDQAAAASNGGLNIPSNVSNFSLRVGSITPSGTTGSQPVQRITYTKTTGGTVNLAINANGQVFIDTSTTSTPNWQPAAQNTSGANIGEWSASATSGVFNGVIYVNGGVTNLNGPARVPATANTATSTTAPPAIASFMKLNLSATGNIGITSDIRYQDPPCTDAGDCPNEAANNIFGIYSATGNVNIVNQYGCSDPTPGVACTTGYLTRTPSAPPNVSIQAVLMAGQGKVTVDGYAAGPKNLDRGSVNLVGGIIENYYGAFGTVSTTTSGTGYGRNFVYDTRTAKGVLPPSFPTARNWTTTLNADIKLSVGPQTQQSNLDYNKSVGN